jgi:putative Holliday junction resolvase
MTQFSKALGIDYGTQRVGTALSFGSLAEPLTILPNSAGLLDHLKDIVEKHHIEVIVVGVSENEMAEKTKQFIELLKTKVQVPIEVWDETLTSSTVHQKLAEKSGKKKTYKGYIDHLAAAEILQDWLDIR